jgi:hypothetical protein
MNAAASGCTKEAEIMDSGLIDHQVVVGPDTYRIDNY